MTERHRDKKAASREVTKTAFRRLGIMFAFILLAVNTYQLSGLGSIVERVDRYNRGVIDEIGAIRGDVYTFGNDLNEIRKFLLLPERKYSFSESGEQSTQAEESLNTRTGQAVYGFMNTLVAERNLQKKSAEARKSIETLMNDQSFKESLKSTGLTASGGIEDTPDGLVQKIAGAGGKSRLEITISKNDLSFSIGSILGLSKMASKEYENLKAEIIRYISENSREMERILTLSEKRKEEVVNFSKDKEVSGLLGKKKIAFSQVPVEEDGSTVFDVTNEEKATLLTVSLSQKDGTISFEGKKYGSIVEMKPAFIEKIKSLDTSSAQDKLIMERRKELETIFKEGAFTELIGAAGMKIALEPRTEYNKILYDVIDSGGKTLFSFFIEMSSGAFKVLQNNEEKDLFQFLQEDGLKKKP